MSVIQINLEIVGLGIIFYSPYAVKSIREGEPYLMRHSNAVSYTHLGVCYEYGDGVEQNWERAVHWFREAAESGVSVAMADLGYCYEKGCGVEQSWEQAFSWYRRGAECGYPVSMSNLGLCYKRGYGVDQN